MDRARNTALRSASMLGMLSMLLVASRAAGEERVTFGQVLESNRSEAITWLPTSGLTIEGDVMRLTGAAVVVESAPLPLHRLHLYDITATMQRTLTARVEFTIVYVDGKGRSQTWQPSWQLPEQPRPNWVPIPPARSDYVQGFVVPADAKQLHLELRLHRSEQKRLADPPSWDLYRLTFVERQRVACCARLKENQLVDGDMETVSEAGVPAGWTHWQPPSPNNLQQVSVTGAPSPSHVLRIEGGGHVVLLTRDVPVARGEAWRISLWVRGHGQLQVFAHALSNFQRSPLRIGTSPPQAFEIDAPTWKQLTLFWFAEAPAIDAAQIAINALATPLLELDSLELRAAW